MATTDNEKQAFLDAYSRTGRRNASCKAAGVAYQTFRRWLATDEEFAAAFDDSQQDFVEVLEESAFEKAVVGREETRYDKDGNIIGIKTVYSDTLHLALLKANAPDKYKDRSASELSGPNGAPLEISPETAAARIAAMIEEIRARRGDVDPFA